MGMPSLIQQNQTGATTPLFVDWMQSPFSLSFAAIQAGAPTYNIEYTLDNIDVVNGGAGQGGSVSTTPNATTAANATWFQSSVTGTTGNASGNIASPVRAVRVNVVTSSSTAIVAVTFMQATYPGS